MLHRASRLAPRITSLTPTTTTFTRGHSTTRIYEGQYDVIPDFRRKEGQEYTAPPALGAVERFGGFIPFLGLGAAALVSKEVLLLNANHLFLAHFGFVMTLGYLWGTDAIEGARREEYWSRKNQVDGHLKMTIEALKIHKNILSAASKTHSQLVVALEKDDESWVSEKKYREFEQKVEFRAATVSALEALLVKDANLRKQLELEAAQDMDLAISNVVSSLTEAEKESYTSLAVSLLGVPAGQHWCAPFHEKIQAELAKIQAARK